MVEHTTDNRAVDGSSPSVRTICGGGISRRYKGIDLAAPTSANTLRMG